MNKITDNNFEETINGDGVTIIDCWAEWCPPCKAIKPILEELERELKDVKFVEIDMGANRIPTTCCGVMSLPTLLIYKDGFIEQQMVGMHNKETIRRKIMDVMK